MNHADSKENYSFRIHRAANCEWTNRFFVHNMFSFGPAFDSYKSKDGPLGDAVRALASVAQDAVAALSRTAGTTGSGTARSVLPPMWVSQGEWGTCSYQAIIVRGQTLSVHEDTLGIRVHVFPQPGLPLGFLLFG